jgi:hypothetical protein
MNCEKFQTVASDLARNEMMEANERASALAHFDECESCGQALSSQRELSDGLRSVAEQMNSLQAPAHLEEKLRAAFRAQALVRHTRSAPQRWRYWASAAAAALLIGFAVIAWRAHVASQSQPPIVVKSKGDGASPSKPSKPEQSSPVAAGGNQEPNESAPPRQEAPKRQLAKSQAGRRGGYGAKSPTLESANTLAANNEKEITTDFVALGYGSAMDLQDGGQLVRVEMPRSALARFGLPVNMDRADERVKADVLVGMDGLARAIRLVK